MNMRKAFGFAALVSFLIAVFAMVSIVCGICNEGISVILLLAAIPCLTVGLAGFLVEIGENNY